MKKIIAQVMVVMTDDDDMYACAQQYASGQIGSGQIDSKPVLALFPIIPLIKNVIDSKHPGSHALASALLDAREQELPYLLVRKERGGSADVLSEREPK